MIQNPFEIFDKRLSNIESLLLDLSKPQPETEQTLPDEKRFYGDRELAAYLGCTVQTVSRQKQAGRLPFHRIGRKYFYLRSEIDSALKGKEAI